MTGVWKDCRRCKQHNRMTSLTLDNQEPQEYQEHQELKESRVYQETEGQREYQESWDLLVSLVAKVHLALLV